jgi:acyl-CoA thioester hydrolase
VHKTDCADPALPRGEPLFRWQVRVYYEDTDAAGIVYYANYLKFFERCRTEWLRSVGAGQRELAERHQVQFVVAALALAYRRPARLDDLLDIDLHVTRPGRVSFEFAQSAHRAAEPLASLRIKVGCIDSRSLAPRALPDFIAAALGPGPTRRPDRPPSIPTSRLR